jgi:hypothetical protein
LLLALCPHGSKHSYCIQLSVPSVMGLDAGPSMLQGKRRREESGYGGWVRCDEGKAASLLPVAAHTRSLLTYD